MGAGCFLPLLLGAATLPPGPQISAEAPPPPPELPKTVGRLAGQPALSAGDCATLANQTIEYGGAIRQSGQPVKPGIVRDGLEAVDLGERLDATRADWPELRRRLQELLQPPPPPPEDKKDEKKQDQDKQQQQEQKKDQSQDKQEQSQQQKQEQQPQPSEQPNQQEQKQPGQPPTEPKQENPPPPPPEPQTQQVGGEPPPNQEVRDNPQLAEPLQKLEQVRDQDKPATLYQLMHDNEPKSPDRPKKDW